MSDAAPKQIPPFGLRMPPDLKDRVSRAAEANNRSMNAEIIATLEEKYPPPPASKPLNHRLWMEYLTEDVEKDERLRRKDAYRDGLDEFDRTTIMRPPPSEWLLGWFRENGFPSMTMDRLEEGLEQAHRERLVQRAEKKETRKQA